MRASTRTASADSARSSRGGTKGPLSSAGLESLVDELLALTKRELGGA